MVDGRKGRGSVAVAATVAGVVLAGCASTDRYGGSGMMNGEGAYHRSRLTCSAPHSLPGTTVQVTMADMGVNQMMHGTAPLGAHLLLQAAPATARAGQISLVASNVGWRVHELVILPLAGSAISGERVTGPDGKVDETGSLGEASNSCASGAGTGTVAGTVGWMTVTLPRGHYELLCNLPNHYADGMHEELVVT